MARYPSIPLSGARVAVTGGARGIGLAVATALATEGARVAVGDLDVEEARRTTAALGATGHHLDVRDPDSVATFLAEAEAAHGPLDILVNNAGVMPDGGFLDLDPAMDRLTVEVNLMGVVHGMRAALPGMLGRRRGHIVNVASLAGKYPMQGLAVYNATKFAVVGLTAATRLEYADRGVSLTAVLPSAVDTGLASGIDFRPLPHVAPERIADAVVGSVRSRRAEIAVPGYVGGLARLTQVAPEPALNRLRRLFRDDRAMRPEEGERAAYRERLAHSVHGQAEAGRPEVEPAETPDLRRGTPG